MPNEHDYIAPDPIPAADIQVGTQVTVPVWKRGEIIDWAPGTVLSVDGPEWFIVHIPKYKLDQGYLPHSLNRLVSEDEDWLRGAILNWHQRKAVEHVRSLNVPASWFVGERAEDGTVEVVAIGRLEPTFVWSLLVKADGSYTSSEVHGLVFETGMTV